MPQIDKGWIKDSFLYTGLFLFLLASIHIPFIHWLALWIIPFPFFVLRVKQPVSALMIPLLGIVILFLIGFPLLHILLGILAGCVGAVMGSLYRQSKMTGTDVVLGGLVSGFVVSLISMAVMQWAFRLFDTLSAMWLKEWNQAQTVLQESGLTMPEDMIPPVEVFVLIFLLMALVPMVLITFSAARRWLVSKGYENKPLPPFYKWRLPKAFFYFFIIVMLLQWLVVAEESGQNFHWIISVLLVLHILFFIQGLSLLGFLLKQKHKSLVWLLPAVLLAWFPPVSFVILLMGMIDSGTPLRKRMEK